MARPLPRPPPTNEKVYEIKFPSRGMLKHRYRQRPGKKKPFDVKQMKKKKNENPIGRSTPPDGPMRALTLGALWPCTCEERAFTWTHLASEAECTSTHSRVCVTSYHCHFLVFSSFLTYVSQFVKMGNVSGSANEMTCVFLFPILLEPLGVLSFNCFIHLLYLMS